MKLCELKISNYGDIGELVKILAFADYTVEEHGEHIEIHWDTVHHVRIESIRKGWGTEL